MCKVYADVNCYSDKLDVFCLLCVTAVYFCNISFILCDYALHYLEFVKRISIKLCFDAVGWATGRAFSLYNISRSRLVVNLA